MAWYDPTQETGWEGSGQQSTRDQISNMYKDVLGREADQAGLDYWANSGMNLSDIARSFGDSEEFQNKFDNMSTGQFVGGLYNNVLDRNADKAGFDYWYNSGQNKADVLGNFYGSKEYRTGRDPYSTSSLGGSPVNALNNFGNQSLGNSSNYSNILKGYYDNPSSFALNPAYQSMMKYGTEAINRNAASKGLLGSGNRLYELNQFGSDLGNKAFDTEANRLGNLANMYSTMGNQSYGTAGNLYGIQSNAANQQYNNYLQTIGALGNLGTSGFKNEFDYLGALSGATTGNSGAAGNLFGNLGSAGVLSGNNKYSGLGSLAGLFA